MHSFTDLYFDIKTGKTKIKVNKTDIANFDLVFVRRAGKYVRFMGAISKYLDKKKIKFVDPAFREIGMSMDKASSTLRLAIKRVPVPHTIFCFKENIIFNKKNNTGLGPANNCKSDIVTKKSKYIYFKN